MSWSHYQDWRLCWIQYFRCMRSVRWCEVMWGRVFWEYKEKRFFTSTLSWSSTLIYVPAAGGLSHDDHWPELTHQRVTHQRRAVVCVCVCDGRRAVVCDVIPAPQRRRDTQGSMFCLLTASCSLLDQQKLITRHTGRKIREASCKCSDSNQQWMYLLSRSCKVLFV